MLLGWDRCRGGRARGRERVPAHLCSLLATWRHRCLPHPGCTCNTRHAKCSLALFADLHHLDADPDPACQSDADPDPTFHFDADPDSSFQIKARNLEELRCKLMRIRIQLIILMQIRILPFNLMRIHADPDPQHWFCLLKQPSIAHENITKEED